VAENSKKNRLAIATWILPACAVAVVFVMLVPMPALALDILLSISITMGVLVLLAAVHILKPVQFSVFPTLLLLLTLFRLALNIASSRRILLHGAEGAEAAGSVIASFGQFVVGGNFVVGFVIFLALVAIQYIVISHGAVRTAEVTARFTLDAMPGKQMAIDADLNAGLIDEVTARERREGVAAEAEFYGAMDGAARFSQRDAMATILITAINIIAGFLIGVFQLHIPFVTALQTYTILTVGDGLVTLIPSLLVSVAGGLVLTRAKSKSDLGADIQGQLFTNPKALGIGSATIGMLAIMPGLPKLPFFLISVAVGVMAWRAKKTQQSAAAEVGKALASGAAGQPGAARPSEKLDELIVLDELALEVGYGLVPIVDVKQGGQLLQRVRALRRHMAQQLGFIIPSVHITDNLRLRPREYVISLRGVEVARWEMRDDCLLAISPDPRMPEIPGIETKDPAFGVPARWISPDDQEKALAVGCAVVDQTSTLATHLSEIIRQYAHELLSRSETKRLLDKIGETHPKLIEELAPKLMTLGEVQKVLQQLLREQVSIRDLGAILEALVEIAPLNKNTVVLVEAARQALARSLVRPHLSDEGTLKVVTVTSEIEEQLAQAMQSQSLSSVSMQPNFVRRVLEGLRALIGDQSPAASPVILCGSPARFHLRRLLEPFLPKVVVLSPGEIPPTVAVQSLGSLK